MKNQGLRRLGGLIMWGAILLLWCQVTGCSGKVSGKVFLDLNSNGVLDPNEPGVSQIKMSILVDGKVERTGYTNPAGGFSVKSKWQKGSICVKLEEKIEAHVTTSEGKAMRVPTLLAQTTSTDSDGNGLQDNKESGNETEEDDTEDDMTDDEKKPAEEKKKVVTGWTTNGYCEELKFGYADVNVPIQIDHKTTVEEIPEYEKKDHFAGEALELKIARPADCELKPLQLPSELKLDEGSSQAASVNVDTNVVTFSESPGEKVIVPEIRASVTSTNASAELDHTKLLLKVKEDISATAKDIKLKPVAVCGSETFELPEIPMTVKRDVNFVVNNDLQASALTLDGPFTIEVKVKNKGKSPVPAGELVIRLPEGIRLDTSVSPPANCRFLGQTISCRVAKIDVDTQSSPFVVHLKTPPSAEVTAAATYTITSSFTPEGMEKENSEDDIVFTLRPAS